MLKIRKILLFILGLHTLLLTQNPALKSISTVSGQFIRTTESADGADSTSGEFYYFSPKVILFQVKYPLDQVMRIEGNVTLVYYPKSKKAFELTSENPVILPLAPGLIATLREDYGLTESGFKLDNQEIKKDTLFTLWKHREHPDKIGRFKLAHLNDLLVYSYYESPDGKIKNKTSFSNYILTKEKIKLPAQIFSRMLTPQGLTFERVYLDKVEINSKIPEEIVNFTLPADAKVEKKKW